MSENGGVWFTLGVQPVLLQEPLRDVRRVGRQQYTVVRDVGGLQPLQEPLAVLGQLEQREDERATVARGGVEAVLDHVMIERSLRQPDALRRVILDAELQAARARARVRPGLTRA